MANKYLSLFLCLSLVVSHACFASSEEDFSGGHVESDVSSKRKRQVFKDDSGHEDKKAKHDVSPLLVIPSELYDEILHGLNLTDVHNLAQTSKGVLSRVRNVWNMHKLRVLKDFSSRVGDQLGYEFCHGLPSNHPYLSFSTLKRIEQIDCQGALWPSFVEHLNLQAPGVVDGQFDADNILKKFIFAAHYYHSKLGENSLPYYIQNCLEANLETLACIATTNPTESDIYKDPWSMAELLLNISREEMSLDKVKVLVENFDLLFEWPTDPDYVNAYISVLNRFTANQITKFSEYVATISHEFYYVGVAVGCGNTPQTTWLLTEFAEQQLKIYQLEDQVAELQSRAVKGG